ncbi:MAG TPA: hypothetical protein VNO75_04540 [Gemmatimonadaceae bacterium]|nr:hypothetical protein [Gemmatimonadaceae bacterium]
MRRIRPFTSERRGFALIAAIWLLVAFAAIGLGISLHSRARRLSAANILEETRALAAAEAGLEHLRSRLARLSGSSPLPALVPAPANDPWRYASLVLSDTVPLGDQRYRVRIRDAGGSLNLNRVDEETLRRLLIALRIDAARATDVAQAVLDWRDADDLHRLNGAEREDYIRTGASALPANAPFSRVEELQFVHGMTPELFTRMIPLLTIVGTGQVNMNAAPRPVLLALPGMSEEAAAVVERMKISSKPLTNLQELAVELSADARAKFAAATPELQRLVTFQTWELEVRSEGWNVGSAVQKRIDALVARAGGGIGGVVAWRKTS